MDYQAVTASTSNPPQAIETTEHQNLTHESKIPPIALKVSKQLLSTPNLPVHTTLSFALPTSLAFFKRLTWELTPWTHPLPPTTAHTISTHIPSLTPTMLSRALLLGIGFQNSSYRDPQPRPHLYVLFPHLHRALPLDNDHTSSPSTDPFLHSWHRDIIKPSFDEAWMNSELVPVYETDADGTVWVTGKAAPSFEAVCERFYNKGLWLHRPQHVEWPFWEDEWRSKYSGAGGLEGGWSDARAKVLGEAWRAASDMGRGLGAVDDMVLLAVWEKEVKAEGVEELVERVGKEWDGYVDSRFVEEGKFLVDLEGGNGIGGEEALESSREMAGGWLEKVSKLLWG